MHSIDPRLPNSNQTVQLNNTQENDDLFFSDPVSHEQMNRPLIDQAGHSFERSTIDSLVADAIRKGQPIICPLGREIIDPNRLVPNLLARDCIEQIHIMRAKANELEHKCEQESKVKVLLQKEVKAVKNYTETLQNCFDEEKNKTRITTQLWEHSKAQLEDYKNLVDAERDKTHIITQLWENTKKENVGVQQTLEMIVAQLRSNDAQNQQLIRQHEQRHQELIRKIDDQGRKIDTLAAENRELRSAFQASRKEVQGLTRRIENLTSENQIALRKVEELKDDLLIENKRLTNSLNMTPFDHIAVSVFCVPRENFIDRDLPQRKVRQDSGEQRQIDPQDQLLKLKGFLATFYSK